MVQKLVKSFVIIVTVMLLLSYGVMAEEKVVRLTNGDWPPYCSPDLKYYGLATRIVTEAFALEGVRTEYEFFPWKRAMVYVKDGKWDGTVGWMYTDERAEHSYFSDPFLEYEYVFFHLKSYAVDWKTLEDLKGISIGATRGYHISEAFTEAEKAGKIKVELATKDVQNLKKLLAGRIKLFPADLDVATFILNKKFTPEQKALITYHPKRLNVQPAHLLLSKKIARNARLLDVFNKGLKRLKESGKLKQFVEESRRGEYIINKK
ncbi:MAG: amino acid ABC transporter substrate-binding protein [Desulfobacterales bacterium]|nr:amino acid ABC transporter substrate-binding protein [Desulfobacterales bacterium]